MVTAVLAVLAAGVVSYWMHAVGDQGPLVGWGHADADRQIPTAWLQIAVHVVVAVAVAVAARRGALGSISLAATVVAMLWLTMWAVLHTGAALGYTTELVNLWQIVVPPSLVALYVLAFVLLARHVRRCARAPCDSPAGGARQEQA